MNLPLGKIYIVRARPGNKEYLTVKVHSLITRIEKLGITTCCILRRE